MARTRLLLLLILLSVSASLALLLPGWFKDPRELIQGEWQEINKAGYVEVTDCTARCRSGNHKANFHYNWIQTDSEPYTLEISRNGETWLIGLTFEDDDHALVSFYIMEKLPPEARDFIRQKNRARNRPEDELIMRFKRTGQEK